MCIKFAILIQGTRKVSCNELHFHIQGVSSVWWHAPDWQPISTSRNHKNNLSYLFTEPPPGRCNYSHPPYAFRRPIFGTIRVIIPPIQELCLYCIYFYNTKTITFQNLTPLWSVLNFLFLFLNYSIIWTGNIHCSD